MRKRCVVCGKDASIVIDRARVAFCNEHFIEYYERMIKRTLNKNGFNGGKVVVAVSGGKDSMALMFALNKLKNELNIKLTALHIDLGINDYSKESRDIFEKEVKKLDIDYIVVKAEDYLGVSIPEAIKFVRKPACSVCGLVKRWIMNKIAYDMNYDYVATGHNLDDISTYFMKAMFTYRSDDLIRGNEVISPPKPDLKIVGRLRPQIFLTEKENLFYCIVNGVNYIDFECPLSEGALLKKYKRIWETALNINPMSQYNFTRSILSIREKFSRDEIKLTPCKICGFPTTASDRICSFCKLRIRIKERLNKQ